MKSIYLFPHRFKMIGWLLLLPSLAAGILAGISNNEFGALNTRIFAVFGSDLAGTTGWFTTIHTNLTYTLIGSVAIIGALLVAFSREAQEDEYVRMIRLAAFQWSVFVNYALLLILFVSVYGIDFLYVLSYHLFTVIVLFIGRFHYLVNIHYKTLRT